MHTLSPPACLLLWAIWAATAGSPWATFPTHERLLGCSSDLLGTNGLFTDTSHVCLLPPPHLPSPAKALRPLPAPRCAPLPCAKAGTQGATAPAALPPYLQKGSRKAGEGTSAEMSGVHWSVGMGCFLQISFEKQSSGCSLGMVKLVGSTICIQMGKDMGLFGRIGLFRVGNKGHIQTGSGKPRSLKERVRELEESVKLVMHGL